MALGLVPEIRVRSGNSMPVRQDGDFVLYWMIASRRASWNFALDRCVEWAEKLQRPLVVLEALRCDYRWASPRLHHFILDGMAENACRLMDTGILYYPYLEPAAGEGKGLLAALASHACVVVTDDFPSFFLPRMVETASRRVPVLLELVDSNGLLPMSRAPQAFPTAFAFRRFLQKELPQYLTEFPKANALSKARLPAAKPLSKAITNRWPMVSPDALNSGQAALAGVSMPNHLPRVETRGGSTAAQTHLREFLRNQLPSYLEERNQPELQTTSALSPYLHFGHISVHQVFHEIAKQEEWVPGRLALRATGKRTGWWGMAPSAEAFLDQVVTWRELGFNFCHTCKDYDQFDSLPAWALKTLGVHTRDERTHLYTLEQFERAITHDPLWNAAQTQLAQEGRIHNYLRMLWGKKILEWTRSPEQALQIMLELNNKYAIDGRDPNSYSGIFWCLGRYDRPWGPERPVFGTVRYMSSENTARKFHVREYIREYNLGN